MLKSSSPNSKAVAEMSPPWPALDWQPAPNGWVGTHPCWKIWIDRDFFVRIYGRFSEWKWVTVDRCTDYLEARLKAEYHHMTFSNIMRYGGQRSAEEIHQIYLHP